MIPLIIFVPLCVFLPGIGENCEYEWTHISDRATFEAMYVMYGGKDVPSKVGAFTVMSEKRVIFYSTDISVAVHEMKHLHCDLLYEKAEDKLDCNIKVEMENRSELAHGTVDPTPAPPLVTEKMKQSEFYNIPYVM